MSVGYLTVRENEIELLVTNAIICVLLALKRFIRNRFGFRQNRRSSAEICSDSTPQNRTTE